MKLPLWTLLIVTRVCRYMFTLLNIVGAHDVQVQTNNSDGLSRDAINSTKTLSTQTYWTHTHTHTHKALV